MKQRLLLCCGLLLLFLRGSAQSGQYAAEWQIADSLIASGLPVSAEKIANKIYRKAEAARDDIQAMKAQLYLLSLAGQNLEATDSVRIAFARNEAARAPFPYKAVWQSITAQLYWNYYERHRWQILQRTPVENATEIDFALWDAARFYREVSSWYLQSLGNPGELQQQDISRYKPVLVKGINTERLRPTLYDLLAFRALAYFENEEKDITRPAYKFRIDGAEYFSDAAAFINIKLTSKDSLSLHSRALELYRKLLVFHLGDTDPAALIDADLQRLAFVYQHSVHPGKNALYRDALQRTEQKYADHPGSAVASYRLAALMTEEEGTDPASGARRGDLPAAKAKLEKIIARYPGSEGGALAKEKLQQLTSRELQTETEKTVLPGTASLLLVSYRNVPRAWFRVVPFDAEDFRQRNYRNEEESSKLLDKLLERKPVYAWSETLPGVADLRLHSAEVKIDPLPEGVYAVIASSDESSRPGKEMLSYTVFQVSRISLLTLSGPGADMPSGYVLDRKSGAPIAGAELKFFTQHYDSRTRTYELRKAAEAQSRTDGSFHVKGEQLRGVEVQYGESRFFTGEYFNFNRREPAPQKTERTFFFTDRSLYRPGQEVHFKAILVQTADNGRNNKVIPGRDITISFTDANGQKIASRTLRTNDFGSVAGTFTAPESGLTGSMQISGGNGYCMISVEEYKRPRFEVRADTLKQEFALNDTVTITGQAHAYAGNPVDGAVVSYRVVRMTRFPYYWMYYRRGLPRAEDMEIASGITQTRADGSYAIRFAAIPDQSIDESTQPVFTYTVHTDVTDLNGETRSTEQSVSVGYTSMQISAAIPAQARPRDLDSLQIRTLNLNGNFVPASINIRISLLAAPATVYRERLWEKPDQHIMEEAAFRKLFPLDAYGDEDKPESLGTEKTVYESTPETGRSGQIAIPPGTWKTNGWYLVDITAKDRNGKTVREKKYLQVYDPALKGSVMSAALAVKDKEYYEPGEKARLWLTSGFEQANWIRMEQSSGSPAVQAVTTSAGTPAIWSRNITETDRGGISLGWIMVKDNRVYEIRENIPVPWSNKELSIHWETHRDKLEPGAKETWTMTIRGSKKEQLAAEMAATLYDASLDAFRPHHWQIHGLYPGNYNSFSWSKPGFGAETGTIIPGPAAGSSQPFIKQYDELIKVPETIEESVIMYARAQRGKINIAGARTSYASEEAASKNAPAPEAADQARQDEPGVSALPAEPVQLRKDLSETAFFRPQLRTDEEGNIRISFTIPGSLTEWKLLAFSHTADLRTGMLEGRIKTQKDLMVIPGLPRFLRQGDRLVVSTKISNLSSTTLNGTSTLELLDAQTLRPLNLPFRLTDATVPFSAGSGASAGISWTVHIPESLYQPVIVRIKARAGNFTDGEEHILPVVSNRMLVTETLPLWINGYSTKKFSFGKLLQSDSSNTLTQHRLTVSFTGNPAWYAVQALPYLMEYPYESADQIFNRYYANSLAAYIADLSPRVRSVFETWRQTDTAALLSNLEKNQELKSALLEETPWVLDAGNETAEKHRIALLFEKNKLDRSLDASLSKLKDLILPEGGFPWYKGNNTPDRYITQYITTGLGRLQHLGVPAGKTENITGRTLRYLDEEIVKDYKRLQTGKANTGEKQIGYLQIQYLYMRSLFPAGKTGDPELVTAISYYRAQAKKYWASFNPYMKGMIALAMYRSGDRETAGSIIRSLRETAIRNEETGMYWMQPGRSWWWYEAPVEAQSLLIESFSEITGDTAATDAMKLWLLKQKQTQHWRSTRATADACYALLLRGSQWLDAAPDVTIRLGTETIRSRDQQQEAGTGYFKTSYEGRQISPGMGDITITTSAPKPGHQPGPGAYGGVYWQYFEQMDKISSAVTSLTVKKQLFIERNSDRGPVLEPVTPATTIKPGDKIRSRIEVTVDRDMEYVHLKDMRGAGFEPVNILSGYRWQQGLGYYESTTDLATSFFFGYLRKGKYVFEYPMFATNQGDFSAGIVSIQCLYAPEFSAHSEGIRVSVGKP